MVKDTLNILLVEDNPADAYLLQKLLRDMPSIRLTHVERLNEAIGCLQAEESTEEKVVHSTPFDAVLLDLSLPDSRGGLDTVKRMHAADPEMTILVLTGLDDEETAIASLREGAQDYLVKGQIPKTLLIRSIHYAIERQQHLDELQHLNEELRRSNEELEQFAYLVSHDLQQPLQVIYGFAKLLAMAEGDRVNKNLADSPEKDPTAHYIDHIVNASKQMSQLIQDLLSYSKVGKSETQSEPTDCNQVIEQVLKNLQPTIESTQATVIVAPMPTLTLSNTQLVQLFQNLLSNALKYHPPNQRPEVAVSVERQAKFWRFSIGDNGIGIRPENAEKVFQIFQRLHTKTEYPGTGIGLATCKKIVESHGGRIWVDPETKAGTTFHFTLPDLVG